MNKSGNNDSGFRKFVATMKKINNSYIVRLFKKILSILSTLLLIFLLILGALMFYFNMQAKSYSERGINYTPPFGLYTIISGSMQPSINVYDVVVATEVNDLNEIKVGDVITFVSSWDMNFGATVTHRVISIAKSETGEFQFVTKGDFNQEPDGAVVTQSNLIGKVVLRIPQLGRIQFFLATKMGWFMIVFIPALAIIIWDLVKIFKLYVLKDKIDKVKDTKEADKIYFDNDILDSRDIYEDDLSKTININALQEEELSLKLKNGVYTDEDFVKLKEEETVVQEELIREPLKVREVLPSEEKEVIKPQVEADIPKENIIIPTEPERVEPVQDDKSVDILPNMNNKVGNNAPGGAPIQRKVLSKRKKL